MRLAVCFIANDRDECISLLNSQPTAGIMQNMKFLLQHMKKIYSSSETTFKYLIQRQKVNNHNHVFQILFHEIFLEDKLKIQKLWANSQSTIAIFFWFGPRVSMRKTCNLKRRQLFAMATRFRTHCCLDKEALLAKYVATNKGNNFCHQLIFYRLISDLQSSCLWNAGLNHFLSRFKM